MITRQGVGRKDIPHILLNAGDAPPERSGGAFADVGLLIAR
jgi:hypothetical protein